ncbi:hypothetical protein K493DRAFT_332613 [Basidiobolus meristosporus CBS 931.73]|uniref:Snurportin-1 n=1 Tax=Basidiobolus meristosporus CBS 931.73 TaxID=1314790 RepID=A0A1Y1ZCA4_9FUNG|nr:hypothetical protein K493DRAFT_332613 [Basidiobolus meristosporus CBS 931.73]|eukprot:ORY07878.1 hypothetical protein K493DRAFT_332613 [Basidiobolus meristosporus CBS 931.73]
MNPTVEDQNVRREILLSEQKKRKRDFSEYAQELALSENNQEESESDAESPFAQGEKRKLDDETDDSEGQDTAKRLRIKGHFRDKSQKKNPYADQLMYAEWMIQVPPNLFGGWYMVLCPKGKRCMIVAANGKTICRAKSGRIFKQFQSTLPAGSGTYRGNRSSDYCILDCIFDENSSTFYVLDLMCWKGMPFYDCATEFRFFWLQSKLAELDPPRTSAQTAFQFRSLQVFDCAPESLTSLAGNPYQLGYQPDGLLFFNKEAHYEIGDTPLCGWVGLEKIDEIIGSWLSHPTQSIVLEQTQQMEQ